MGCQAMKRYVEYFRGYPKVVFLILSNEFCERFSYYGMKAILVIYLNLALGFSEGTSVSIYHTFNVLCYFTPLLGAMIADGWLGKYRTILYLSILYALGNVVMTVTAIPTHDKFLNWPPFIGLAIIAFGTGGIKPCVSAFGGDQFSPAQQRQKDSFFSLFYMSINVGSLLTTIVSPLIRSNVYCFGQQCYAVAFGIPAALMVVAILCFVAGTRWYKRIPPGESIIIRMFGCIRTALYGRCSGVRQSCGTKDHWLDYAEPKYDKRFIADVKDVLSVCWLFLPLPMFWALFDQQGSRWTLQAKNLNGDVGGFLIQPDMIQVANSVFVILFVPILESLIYPCFDKLKIPNRPLQRMSFGMMLAGVAFIIAAILQIFIDNESPRAVIAGEVKYSLVNTSPCLIRIPQIDSNTPGFDLSSYENTGYFYTAVPGSTPLPLVFDCPGRGVGIPFNLSLDSLSETQTYQIMLNFNQANIFSQTQVDFTKDLQSTLRVYSALSDTMTVNLTTTQVGQQEEPISFSSVCAQNISEYKTLLLTSFYVDVVQPDSNDSRRIPNFELESRNGAVYTLLLLPGSDVHGSFTVKQLTDVPPRGISIFAQIPQYAVISLGEVLFSVTGLAFAYTQASISMKSILSAVWLLTVAFGNVIVVIVAESGSSMKQMAEFFLFAGLMFLTTAIFIVQSLFYHYVEPRPEGASSLSSVSGGMDDVTLPDGDKYDVTIRADNKDDREAMSDGSETPPPEGFKELSSFGKKSGSPGGPMGWLYSGSDKVTHL